MCIFYQWWDLREREIRLDINEWISFHVNFHTAASQYLLKMNVKQISLSFCKTNSTVKSVIYHAVHLAQPQHIFESAFFFPVATLINKSMLGWKTIWHLLALKDKYPEDFKKYFLNDWLGSRCMVTFPQRLNNICKVIWFITKKLAVKIKWIIYLEWELKWKIHATAH